MSWIRYCAKCHLEIDLLSNFDIEHIEVGGRNLYYHGACWLEREVDGAPKKGDIKPRESP